MLDGRHAWGGATTDNSIYVAINMHWADLDFGLPGLPPGQAWHVFANTGMPSPHDIWSPGSEPLLGDQGSFHLAGRSVCILVAR
jgi:glycogen operon protein